MTIKLFQTRKKRSVTRENQGYQNLFLCALEEISRGTTFIVVYLLTTILGKKVGTISKLNTKYIPAPPTPCIVVMLLCLCTVEIIPVAVSIAWLSGAFKYL